MRQSKAQKHTIGRTCLPNLNTVAPDFNNTDLFYFYRIKRNLRLEAWQNQREKHTSKPKHTDKYNYSLSPRLRMLAQAKQTADHQKSTQINTKRQSLITTFRKEQTFNQQFFNQNRFFFVKEDGLQFTQQENIGKNINGTALGVFSQQTITQKLESSRSKIQDKQPKEIMMTRELDSDKEGIQQQKPEPKKESKRIRKLSLISRNSSMTSNKLQNRLFDKIYGDEQFLDKYKSQQMALMQKNSVYRQKKFTLDYKNQWRI